MAENWLIRPRRFSSRLTGALADTQTRDWYREKVFGTQHGIFIVLHYKHSYVATVVRCKHLL